MSANRSRPAFEVIRARGPLTVEDGGRPRQVAVGMPLGGFADPPAARLANRLVGNLDNAPLLEIALAAPRLRFCCAATIAWAGADTGLTLNGEPLPAWRRIQVEADDILDGGGVGERGLFSYLAVGGAWDVERWRGSVSPLRLGAEVWPRKSVLAASDHVWIEVRARPGRAWSKPVLPWWAKESIRPVFSMAPESGLVARVLAEGQNRAADLTRTNWRVDLRASDRMGVRLTGGPAWFKPPAFAAERYSGAVLPGVVQWLVGGDLIVAGVSCQTIGGYPRIGWVS